MRGWSKGGTVLHCVLTTLGCVMVILEWGGRRRFGHGEGAMVEGKGREENGRNGLSCFAKI